MAWPLTDHLGSVRDLVVYDPTTETVSVVKHVVYDAYGNVTSDTATGVESLFLYTARPFDPDTGLQNNLNRWYDATTGRWMTVDPSGFAAGDVNLYRYVGNSATIASDPFGLWELFDSTGAMDQNNPSAPHPILSQYDGRALYIAGRGDTFASLLTEVNRRRVQEGKKPLKSTNKYCVRPVPVGGYCGTGRPIATDEEMQQEWESAGKPARCGLYDAGNMLDLWGIGGPVEAGVGTSFDNGYLQNMGAFYGIPENQRHLSKAEIVERIKQASGEGLTPIQSMTLIGHSARRDTRFGDQGGLTDYLFGAEDLATGLLGPNDGPVGLFGIRAWTDAVAGIMPPVGWFRGDKGTEVRFVGCRSSKVAIAFASKVLRGDAVAWGTSLYTYPAPGGKGASFVRFSGSTDIVTKRLARNPDEFENVEPWSKHWGEAKPAGN